MSLTRWLRNLQSTWHSRRTGASIGYGVTVAITGSTRSGNSAPYGGGIYNLSGAGAVNVGTTTFFGNTSDNIVGGYTDLGGNVFLP
jgi:hypothetical protein